MPARRPAPGAPAASRARNSKSERAARGSRTLRSDARALHQRRALPRRRNPTAIVATRFLSSLSFLRRGFAQMRSARSAARLLAVGLDRVLADLAIERGEADAEAARRFLL